MRGTIIVKGILTARVSCRKATEYGKMLGEVSSVLSYRNSIGVLKGSGLFQVFQVPSVI